MHMFKYYMKPKFVIVITYSFHRFFIVPPEHMQQMFLIR